MWRKMDQVIDLVSYFYQSDASPRSQLGKKHIRLVVFGFRVSPCIMVILFIIVPYEVGNEF